MAAGFRETLRVLRDLAAGGQYPLRHSDDCTWCAYEAGCRHDHPPTLVRLENFGNAGGRGEPAQSVRRYQRLVLKQEKTPALADVAGVERPDEDDRNEHEGDS